MFIEYIEISNYRPYYGTQRITFDYSEEKNMIVILANNGSGKSSLLNAFTWCFYGEELHDKRDKAKPKLNLLAEAEAKGNSLEVSVEIKFYDYIDDEKVPLIIKRSQNYSRSNKGGFKERGDSRLIIKEWIDGEEEITYDDNSIIKQLIPKDINNYFFFNGETLAGYFDYDAHSNVNLKESVERLSQVNLLGKIEDHITTVKSSYSKELKNIDKNFQKILDDIEFLEKEKKIKQKKYDDAKNQRDKAISNIQEIDRKLAGVNSKKIKELQNKRTQLEKDKESVSDNIDSLSNKYQLEVITTYPIIKLFDVLEEAVQLFDESKEDKQIPSPIEKDLLRDILRDKICICGTNLANNPQALELIQNRYDKTIDVSTDEALMYYYDIKNLLKTLKTRKNNIISYKKDLNQNRENLKSISSELRSISDEIKGNDTVKIIQLESHRVANDNLKNKSQRKMDSAMKEIIELESKLEKAKTERRKLDGLSKKAIVLNKKIDFCENVIDVVSNLHYKIEMHILKKINEKTTDQFTNIHWADDKFSNVQIKENYELSIHEKDGNVVKTGDLSGGEEAILALSFMIALHSISGFDLPLFIDAPLEKMDLDKGDDFIKDLHEFTKHKQIIFLFTNRQYTSDTKEMMKTNLSLEYELKHSFNKTEIVENEK